MKKMLTLAAILCCAMTATVFTACGSDDDNSSEPAKDPASTAVMNCTLYTNDAALESFDYYVKYYDANGKEVSEKITWSENLDNLKRRTWTKNLVAKLPAKVGVYMEVRAKDGVDLEVAHKMAYGYAVSFASLTASGQTIREFRPASRYDDMTIKKGMVQEFLSNENPLFNQGYEFDAEGKVVTDKLW